MMGVWIWGLCGSLDQGCVCEEKVERGGVIRKDLVAWTNSRIEGERKED